MSHIICIIPARFASTRFPGKLLADQTGKPLIQHVWEAARRATLPQQLVIATDDNRIRAAAADFGAEVIMTAPDHPNGTSRLAEAAQLLDLPPDAIVVNAQGDEPELDSHLIDLAAQTLAQADTAAATIASPMQTDDDASNPNVVKVTLRNDGRALYFSRSPIPYQRPASTNSPPPPTLRHIGLYAYRTWFLKLYRTLPPTPAEQAEQLEQLRILQHGHDIQVAICPAQGQGIDTPEQYQAFVERWREHKVR